MTRFAGSYGKNPDDKEHAALGCPAAERPSWVCRIFDRQGPRGAELREIRKAVFPVDGLGTRFIPATKAVPKEMLTVVDKPVIRDVVDEAVETGIEHFVFVTGRGKGVIEDYFDIQH